MLIVERQKKLLEIIKEQKTVQLEGLAEALGVSSSTVRRDVEVLEQQGLVERTHGGVIFRPRNTSSLALEERLREQVEAKRAIGAAAAKLVEPGMTVYLDGGSTIQYCIPQIEARPLQVVTNSLTVANHFAADDRVELLVLGGSHYPRTGVLVGPVTTQALVNLHADLLLFSCAGLFENEVFNSSLVMTEVERLAIRQAARKICLIDSTKFGRKSLARICAVDELDLLITDAGVSERWVRELGDRLQVAR
ncbi:MAG TPA: DeoR/GlpR family DNA-binding transcription regulator [Phycisphaerae bacterium]|nr:DeoR/GlpR family DNA-binding transcription regulator [Phycisphaerae bacterium]